MEETLHWQPAATHTELLAGPVAEAVRALADDDVHVAAIDPGLADTAAFCEKYGVALDESANCVIVAGKRGGEVRYAACMVLATMRADVNGVIRKRLDVRKSSFAPMAEAVELTGMEYGGITPLGLPADWPILVDSNVASHNRVVIGSGVRRSKLAVSGALLAGLKGAEVLDLATGA
ncbi:YbaK/EbsC family protein [Nonomuraea endophytica]|uniref:Prolyl-tRNA editing enzyme YbaK/EbsC (Cys-tRNA(Pro) deacylase) n=1 Tax=Nonomuraea endophytica TaxID=714136 RepID=A0A7W8AEY4_9ACTN|nr:YbaK/EbsC family protein [Nonomuraea endophytica]MBB5083553.1 prolyl-tRNA editing enzyme YbaK/EbsC (Cys-tRNA(Pro) deacylase) [Nonomuraea endophytica]